MGLCMYRGSDSRNCRWDRGRETLTGRNPGELWNPEPQPFSALPCPHLLSTPRLYLHFLPALSLSRCPSLPSPLPSPHPPSPPRRHSQLAFLPCVSPAAHSHPLLRFFPPCVPTLETLALLPPHPAASGNGLTRRLGRLWKRLEKDGFAVADLRMLTIGESAIGHVVAAHAEAVQRLGPDGYVTVFMICENPTVS